MSIDLRQLLTSAADDLVPEPFPLEQRVDGVRRLVRRRRAVARVQTGAGAVVGLVAIGTVATVVTPTTPVAAPSQACGRPSIEVVPDAGPLDGTATLASADASSATVSMQLRNETDSAATASGAIELIVSLPGTGEVVGYGSASASETVIASESAADVVVTTDLLACHGGGAEGVLPDGVYDLTAIGTATGSGGAVLAWTASSLTGIAVTDGVPSAREDGTPPAAFAPVCGEMIPAVEENAFWAQVEPIGGPTFVMVDPAFGDHGGMTLDLEIGTTGAAVDAELGSEIVTVVTDLDGRVVSWQTSLADAASEPPAVLLTLPDGGSQIVPAIARFGGLDGCTEGASLGPGRYRLFVELTVTTEQGAAPVLSVPLDLTVSLTEFTAR